MRTRQYHVSGILLSIALLALLVPGSAQLATQQWLRTGLTALASVPVSAERSTNLAAQQAGVDAGWWSTVQQNIRQSEYQFSWQDQTYLPALSAAYQAPNRAHNLRTHLTNRGPVVIPLAWADGVSSSPWSWGMTLTGYGYSAAIQPVAAAEPIPLENRVEYRREGLIEWYVNDERGLEQGFTLERPPALVSDQGSTVVLEIALSGDLMPTLSSDSQTVEFASAEGVTVLRYASLFVTDATGRRLPARFELSNPRLASRLLRIAVDDTEAVYPITIDPLATSPNWTAESNQASSSFGFAVGTAGDVNGDGYADVIVGARTYDNGQADEGRAFVYYGSAAGLSTITKKLSQKSG